MAWLNLIKHIDWDIETSNIGITPPNNYDLPFRESFRTSIYKQEGWGAFEDRHERVGDYLLRDYVYTIIDNNIGKPFSKCFSYFIRKTRKNTDLKYYYFLREFEKEYGYYFIDNNGLIQLKK